jgi:hypothetical protein
MTLDTLNLPAQADTADVWAVGREHELRADAYQWHQLLAPEPTRSILGLYLDAADES